MANKVEFGIIFNIKVKQRSTKMLEAGIKAPEFKLQDKDGNLVSLSDFKNKKVVLYFYPRDNTPGCTKQACSFRDNYENFKSKDVVVIGDIYVDDDARGMGLSKKILNYLMETYDRDIFAKCVRGSSAEAFWSHVGYQADANIDNPNAEDMYEHRPGKRDLGWYRVTNQNKRAIKEDLW